MKSKTVYIDCSELMLAALARVKPDYADHVHVNIGDPSGDEVVAIAQNAEVIWNGHTTIDAALLARLPALRRIIFLGSGAASYIDLDTAAARGISVETISGYGDRAVAEHAAALMLSAARQVGRMERDLRRGHWEPLEGMELGGKTLGLVGFGGIGRTFADIGKAFGMEVVVWNRSGLTDDWTAHQRSLDEVLAQADVISLHLALTPETRGFFGTEQFAGMKAGALFINTARAGLVDTTAMIDALQSGRLGHAALDVFDMEPLPKDDPLLALANVTLTAHAGFKTREATERLAAKAMALSLMPFRSDVVTGFE